MTSGIPLTSDVKGESSGGAQNILVLLSQRRALQQLVPSEEQRETTGNEHGDHRSHGCTTSHHPIEREICRVGGLGGNPEAGYKVDTKGQ